MGAHLDGFAAGEGDAVDAGECRYHCDRAATAGRWM
jgi:hypothetical protein